MEGGDKSKQQEEDSSINHLIIPNVRTSQNESSIMERIDSDDLDKILFDKDPKLLDNFNTQKKIKKDE